MKWRHFHLGCIFSFNQQPTVNRAEPLSRSTWTARQRRNKLSNGRDCHLDEMFVYKLHGLLCAVQLCNDNLSHMTTMWLCWAWSESHMNRSFSVRTNSYHTCVSLKTYDSNKCCMIIRAKYIGNCFAWNAWLAPYVSVRCHCLRERIAQFSLESQKTIRQTKRRKHWRGKTKWTTTL